MKEENGSGNGPWMSGRVQTLMQQQGSLGGVVACCGLVTRKQPRRQRL